MKNSDVKITDLMSLTGLSSGQVEKELRKLEELGLIRRFHSAIGYQIEMIEPASGLPFDPKTGKVLKPCL
jgi:DNA-binding Lrp family transcriptional regulator